MAKAVVLTGGGIKGAVAAGRYAADHDLLLVHIQYGQLSATAEASAINRLAETWSSATVLTLPLPHVPELDERFMTEPDSPPAGAHERVGEGPAPSAAALRGLMPVIITVGVQCALRVGASIVATGLSRFGDAAHLGLPDASSAPASRHEMLQSLNHLANTLSRSARKITLDAPLVELPLSQIIKLGRRFNVPFERTRSCTGDKTRACGQCQACKLRAEAFAEAKLPDPLMNATLTMT